MIKKFLWIIFWLTSQTSYAFIVTVNLIWNNPLSTYNLEEGSIVQVISYNHRDASRPSNGAINNFNEIEPNVFDSTTTPNNHAVVASSTLDDTTFNMSFDILDNSYSRLYIRIIESLDSDTTILSHWGLTSVRNIPQNGQPWITTWYNVYANQENVFSGINSFEVIPEPSSVSLIVFVLFITSSVLGFQKFKNFLHEI